VRWGEPAEVAERPSRPLESHQVQHAGHIGRRQVELLDRANAGVASRQRQERAVFARARAGIDDAGDGSGRVYRRSSHTHPFL
jgi:hypothetical protein